MPQKVIRVKIFRFDPSANEKPSYKVYKVPLINGMSVLDVLDYIYENVDSSLSFYGHAACRHGLCSGCILLVNGKASLTCQTPVSGDLTIEPPSRFRIIKDLVYTTTK